MRSRSDACAPAYASPDFLLRKNQVWKGRVGWGNDANFNKCLLKTESEKVSPKLLFQRVAKPEKVPFHGSEARLAAEGGFLAVQTRLPCIADKPCL